MFSREADRMIDADGREWVDATTFSDLVAAHDQAVAFIRDLFDDYPNLGTVDGFDLQELAVKHGLMEVVQRAEPCGEGCNCADYYGSDEWPIECHVLLPPYFHGSTADVANGVQE